MRILPTLKQKSIVLIALITLILNTSYAQGRWDTISSAGFTSRYGHVSVMVAGKIYLIGGNTPDSVMRPITTIDVYDPLTNTWSTPATTGEFIHRRGFTAEVFNDNIYIFGGYSDSLSMICSDVSVLNSKNNSWTTITTTGDYFPRYYHCSAVVNEKMYIIGGLWENNLFMNTTDVFDPAIHSWSQPQEDGNIILREGASAAAVNGKIYVVGGFGHNYQYCTTIDEYDPKTNYWKTPLTIGRPASSLFQTAQLVNGKMYILGGLYGSVLVTKFKAYDPLTDSITLVETINKYTPRYGLSSCAFNGKLYVFGGRTSNSNIAPNEVFTPSNLGAQTAPINNIAISLHPNPTTGTFTVKGISEGRYTIKIMNILGEQVMLKNTTKNDMSLDITNLPAGSYFVQITTKNLVETRMIVKQ